MSRYEISGVVEQIDPNVENNNYKVGDRVVIYADEEEELSDSGFAEYVTVKDVDNLIKLPDNLTMDVGALLPCGALTAYSAVLKAKPFVEATVQKKSCASVLIVGAGGLGLWTVRLARHFIGEDTNKVHIAVADSSIDRLLVAQDHGCSDVIHWNDADYEGYNLERTKDVCQGGVDLVIDFVSSPRTVHRAMSVLNRDGVLIVGGNSRYEVNVCLSTLAKKQQVIMGVQKGTREQLRQLVNVFATQKITPPCFQVFPVDQANKVFEQLNQCKIDGRAVLEVCPMKG